MKAPTLALCMLVGLACASAYDDTYNTELDRLESEQAARDTEERAAHAEASRYAAVVYFDLGSSEVGEDGRRELRWFAEKMAPYPKAIIRVQGFADTTGSEPRNQVLSRERAQRVADLLGVLGIESSRIRTEGFATEFPAETNQTAKGRNRNRRVEVTVN